MWAEASGDKPAVIVDADSGGRPTTLTFAALDAQVNRAAHALGALGATRGERVVWCGPNSPEVLVAIHAARKADVVAVPLSYRFNAEEMQYVIDNSDATVVVVDAEQAPLVASVRDRLPKVRSVVGFGGDVPDGCARWDDVLAGQPDTEPGEVSGDPRGSSMIYTSGTTGKPKGALRTRTDPELVKVLVAELRLVVGDEVHITTGPLYHSGPLAFAALTHTLGGSIVLLRKFDASAWVRLVKAYRVTNSFSAPTQLKRIVSLPAAELADADLASMRCLIANAAPVPYPLKQEIVEKLGDGFLFEVYGSTELGILTVLKPADQLRKPGSCGRTYGGQRFRIVKDDGTEAAPGEPGELFISTPFAMDGYHATDRQLSQLDAKAEAEVEKAERAEESERAEPETSARPVRWKSVGDVAYADDEGYLHISDRKTDMIISGGVNIYPAEIEAVLYAHPQILDAAVLGVADDEWGERVYAIVQAKPGETLDTEELAAFVAERVASYKRPRAYEVRDALPRTESGKLLKRVLRDELRSRAGAS